VAGASSSRSSANSSRATDSRVRPSMHRTVGQGSDNRVGHPQPSALTCQSVRSTS
jgi:hypothetical protein